MSSPVRFGIVGLDHWYSAIPLAEGLAAHPGAELVGIADLDISRAEEVAAKTGSPRVTSDLRELIADPDIDVIASFVSVDRNPEICIAAAEAGKHIVSIKPLARTLEEADAIVAAVRKAGVVFIPGESRSRSSELNQLLHKWVAGGRFGRITSASFSLSGGLPQGWPGLASPGWWADAARAPGGGWIDHSLYQIDRMRWLLGEEVAEISGRAANLVHTELAVEDYGHAILRFDGGAMTTIEDTWSGPAGGWRITTSIIGTSGAVAVDTASGLISIFDAENEYDGWIHVAAPSDDSVGIESILAAVAGEGDPIAGVEDAWENLSACLAFYEASASGSVVEPAHLRERSL